MSNRLLAIRRRVAPDRTADYRAGWSRLRSAVGEAGGRAWNFRSANGGADIIEFIEFSGDSDPRDSNAAEAELTRLAELFGAETEEWEEMVDGTS